MLKWTKKEKRKEKKIKIFSHSFYRTRERVRGERKVLHSLYDLQRSGCRNLSSQDLKFIYSTRATRGYRQYAVSLKILGLRRKANERSSTFSLRFTAIDDSVSVEPRLKVGVLVQDNAWTPKSRIYVEDSSGSS